MSVKRFEFINEDILEASRMEESSDGSLVDYYDYCSVVEMLQWMVDNEGSKANAKIFAFLADYNYVNKNAPDKQER